MKFFQEAGFGLCDITPEHCAYVEQLPLHHAEPFDQLLVAQALTVPLRLLTSDSTVARYDSSFILA